MATLKTTPACASSAATGDPDKLNAAHSQQVADQNQLPIEIEADRAEQNEQLGEIIYQGNVAITQGKLKIVADQVRILSSKRVNNQNRQVERIEATGNPATMTQSDPDPGAAMQAKASTILYLPKQQLIKLEDNALLVQQGANVKSERIEYSLVDRKVRAEGSTSDTNARVKTVINSADELMFNTEQK